MTADTITADQLVADFKREFAGKLPDEIIENTVTDIARSSANSAYHANGSILTAFFYQRFTVDITSPTPYKSANFVGNAGGLGFIGGGALIGDVYTDDMTRLLKDTHSFAFTAVPTYYVALYFFDKSSKFLGHFQSGAVSVTGGTGGGRGKWKFS